MNTILQILGDVAYARLSFVRRATPPAHYHRFLENEQLMLSLIRDMVRWQTSQEDARAFDTIRTFLLTGVGGAGRTTTTPPAFWDDVPTPPTAVQIERATRVVDPPGGEVCTICMVQMTAESVRRDGAQTCLTHCNHSFHRRCLDQWWRQSSLCPVCRNDIRQTSTQGNNNVRVRPHTNAQQTPHVGTVQNVPSSTDIPEGQDRVDHSR
jgi:hypothetical protein